MLPWRWGSAKKYSYRLNEQYINSCRASVRVNLFSDWAYWRETFNHDAWE